MKMNFRFTSLVLAFMLCFSAVVFGQETTGGIQGIVRDPNDAIVPGVSVTIQSVGSTAGFNRTLTTDENGYFIVTTIPVGNYSIAVAEAKGFRGVTTNVTVVLGKDTQANIKLEVGSGETIVDVNAEETAALDPTESKLTTNITSQLIQALPKGTTFTSLLKTAPNVREEPRTQGFQIDGASGAENVFVIDGQEVTNFRTGQLNGNNNLPFEILQEVQIKSTGFEAEYGGATGGVINIVTAGGNNEFRGNIGISFTPSKLRGDTRPILSSFGVGAGDVEYFQPRRNGGTNFFPVARIGGPILKNRLWFSAIYAPQLQEITQEVDTLSSSNPNTRRVTETNSYNFNRKTEEAFVRIDAQPTSKLRVYGTFLYNPIIDRGALPGGLVASNTTGLTGSVPQAQFGGSTVVGPNFLRQQGGRQNSNNVNGQLTYTPTNNIVLNVRGGRSFLNEKLDSYGIPRQVRYMCSTAGGSLPQNIPASGCGPGFTNFPSNYQIDYDVSTRKTFDADASFVGINLGGRHNFKGGYQYNGISNTTRQGYIDTGVIVLFYGRSIASSLGVSPTPGQPDCDPVRTGNQTCGSGYLQRFGTEGEASSASQGFFAQDSWQIGNRLTLNIGLRAEVEDVPSFNADNPGIKFGLGDKLAPRLGFALDPLGNGKTKIFGSYGWFYDRFKYELPRGSFGGDFYRRDYFEILPSRGLAYTNYTRQNILGTTPDVAGGVCPGEGAPVPPIGNGFSVCQLDFRIPSNSGAGIEVGGSVDPDLKAARQSEYTIGMEHLLFSSMLVSARYTHKQLDRAIEDIGFPTPTGSEAYVIGNPGFGLAAEQATLNGVPVTKAERKYDAFEVRLDKRVSNNYFFNLSYTFSRLFGNYSGLASTDEVRSSPNVNRFFDLPFLGFTANGQPDNGRLATDRPHVFKAYGGYSFDWFGSKTNSTDISAFTTITSGTPLTTIYTFYSVTSAILNGRGDLGRTAKFTETDLQISHKYRFGPEGRFTFEPFLNILNLFDQKNELGRQTSISGVNFSAGSLVTGGCPATVCTNELTAIRRVFNGGISNFVTSVVGTTPGANRLNTYNLVNQYQNPREVRFGMRLFF